MMNTSPSLRAKRSNPGSLAQHRSLRPWIASLTLAMTALGASSALAEKIFVTNEKDNTVTVLDGDSLKIVETVKTGQRPRDLKVSTDGKSVYIVASDSDRIEVLDIATLKIVGTLPSGSDPERFDVSP